MKDTLGMLVRGQTQWCQWTSTEETFKSLYNETGVSAIPIVGASLLISSFSLTKAFQKLVCRPTGALPNRAANDSVLPHPLRP